MNEGAAAPMSASEEISMSPIARIRKNEAAVEHISVERPSSSEESKER